MVESKWLAELQARPRIHLLVVLSWASYLTHPNSLFFIFKTEILTLPLPWSWWGLRGHAYEGVKAVPAISALRKGWWLQAGKSGGLPRSFRSHCLTSPEEPKDVARFSPACLPSVLSHFILKSFLGTVAALRCLLIWWLVRIIHQKVWEWGVFFLFVFFWFPPRVIFAF